MQSISMRGHLDLNWVNWVRMILKWANGMGPLWFHQLGGVRGLNIRAWLAPTKVFITQATTMEPRPVGSVQ